MSSFQHSMDPVFFLGSLFLRVIKPICDHPWVLQIYSDPFIWSPVPFNTHRFGAAVLYRIALNELSHWLLLHPFQFFASFPRSCRWMLVNTAVGVGRSGGVVSNSGPKGVAIWSQGELFMNFQTFYWCFQGTKRLSCIFHERRAAIYLLSGPHGHTQFFVSVIYFRE